MRGTLIKRFANFLPLVLVFIITCFLLHAQENSRAGGKNCLWEIRTKENTVYLLGSIHFLKQDSYPLSPSIEATFDRVDTLAFEIDLDDAETEKSRQMFLSRGTFSGDGTLRKTYLTPIDGRCSHALS